MSTSDSTPREIPASEEFDSFAMFVKDSDGWRQYAILGAQGAAYTLVHSNGHIAAQNYRTGSRYYSRAEIAERGEATDADYFATGRAVLRGLFGYGSESGESGFASLAMASGVAAVLVLLLVVLPLLSQTIAGVRAASGGAL